MHRKHKQIRKKATTQRGKILAICDNSGEVLFSSKDLGADPINVLDLRSTLKDLTAAPEDPFYKSVLNITNRKE